MSLDTSMIGLLSQLGVEEGIKAICSVYARRAYDSHYDGYRDREHDRACKVATEAICSIGTLEAFQELVRQIDRSMQIEDYPLIWLRSEVQTVLGEVIPADAQRNLICVVLSQPLSSETRKILLNYLRRDSQTMQLLRETLSPGQLGYEDGQQTLVYLEKHLQMAADRGHDPTKHTYIIIERPPNLDKATAIQHQAAFSQARIPTLSQLILENINDHLKIADLPPIDSQDEVPLAYLKVEYPHQTRLSSLKFVAIPRSEVSVNWIELDTSIDGFGQNANVVMKSVHCILTNLRLILTGKSISQTESNAKMPGHKPTPILMFLLRDIEDVKFESPVIRLQFNDLMAQTTIRINVAYPGASPLSVIAGLNLPSESIEEKMSAAEVREYHRRLETKRHAAETALINFFVDVANRNLSNGTSIREF